MTTSNASSVIVEAMETQRSNYEKEYATCEQNIVAWKQQIEQLKQQIKTIKDRQDEICKLDSQELNEDIQVGIQHIKKAQQLETEIEELKRQQSVIECCLAVSASQYAETKDSLLAEVIFFCPCPHLCLTMIMDVKFEFYFGLYNVKTVPFWCVLFESHHFGFLRI